MKISRQKIDRNSYEFIEHKWAYIFISVPIILFLCFTLYPLVTAFIMSFQEYKVLGSEWIGLANYKKALTSDIFWKAMKNTLIYALFTVPINIIIAFIISILIFPLKSGTQTFFKSCYYLPGVTSGVVTSLVWLWMFDPTEVGFFNSIMKSLGLPTQMWLATSKTAMPSMILMTYLGGHGSSIILYLAAMGNIPTTLYEAADLDHANWWTKLTKITWPLLKPTTLYFMTMGIIGSLQFFMRPYLMTGGGPNFATTTISFLIYQHSFEDYAFGLAAAESFILAIIIISISVIQFKYFSTDVEY